MSVDSTLKLELRNRAIEKHETDPRLRAHIVGGWPSKRRTVLNQNTTLNTIPDIESTADEIDDSIIHRNNTPTRQLTPDAPSESNENDEIND